MTFGSLRHVSKDIYLRVVYNKNIYFHQLTVTNAGIYSGSLIIYRNFVLVHNYTINKFSVWGVVCE